MANSLSLRDDGARKSEGVRRNWDAAERVCSAHAQDERAHLGAREAGASFLAIEAGENAAIMQVMPAVRY